MPVFPTESDQIIYLIIRWFSEHYIELLGTTLGLIYIIYSIREQKLLWLFGFITSALYVYIYWKAGFYADMGINVYYVVVSVYGWLHWSSKARNTTQVIPVTRVGMRSAILLLLVTGVLFFLIGFVLDRYTDSDIAWWDAFTTAASITATWMLARKILEHWLVWIVVDAVSAVLYISKGLYPTTLLFIVYTMLAITGYQAWRKSWRNTGALAE